MSSVPLPVYREKDFVERTKQKLQINPELVADYLVKFLQDECIRVRGIKRAVVGVSGGVDSSVTAHLCARAFGPDNTFAFRLPYKISSPESLIHADLVIDQLGLHARTIEITGMVDGYIVDHEPDATPLRVGNVCARCRMVILFDQSAKLNALPIGTGNKSERLLGYFTWHADDAPPINPLGDLFKTQVYQLARYLGVPEVILKKSPTPDLVRGITAARELGITYDKADPILFCFLQGYSQDQLKQLGFEPKDVDLVWERLSQTHWKRHMPTVAVLSDTAINEFYLRPVDYRGQ
ncbi:MAG: NAD+ synthase [Candidatus Caldarchaeum sp.]